jgi:hypothetical protein
VGAWLAVVALAAWGAGVACLGSKVLRWYGIHVVVLALLSAAVVWAWFFSVRPIKSPATRASHVR